MSMKYKTQCICQMPNFEEQVKQFNSFRWMCQCKGTKEEEWELDLDEYDGDFVPVIMWGRYESDHADVSNYRDEVWAQFTCECGDEVMFTEFGDTTVCSCGRIYRISGEIQKDDTHKGDMEYWDKVKADKYNRFEEKKDE